MLQSILKSEGVKELDRKQKRGIFGGDPSVGICIEEGEVVRMSCGLICLNGNNPIGCKPRFEEELG